MEAKLNANSFFWAFCLSLLLSFTGPLTVASAADDARQPSQNIKMANYQLENADYIVLAQMPDVPDQVNLHRGIKVNIRDTAYISGHSVNKAFAFKESQSSKDLRARGMIYSSGEDSAESLISADGNGRSIEYFDSGAVKYMEEDIFSEKQPDLLASQNLKAAAAKSVFAEAATSFIKANNLYNNAIFLKNVSFAKLEEYDVASRQVVGSKIVGAMVHFGYKIDGIKAYGPGSEVKVIFGDGNSVVGYIDAIRGHEAVGNVSLKDPQDAVEDYIQYGEPKTLLRSGAGIVKKVLIDTVELVYYLKPVSVQQDEIRPHYLISGLFTCVDPTSNEKHDVEFEWLEDAVRN
jgi:hypothetical protein